MSNEFRKILCSIFIVLTIVHFSDNASLSIYEQKKYKRNTDSQGLYDSKDDVEILTVENFKSDMYGNQRAWYIEFYNSWCGFCQRFAPSWKALATDIKDWKDLVLVGAIDCSNDENYPTCREFEVMGYPTLKYFHENYQQGPKNLGTLVTKGQDVNELRHYLLDRMITEQQEGRGKMYPTLLPYNNVDFENLYETISEVKRYVFLIVEDSESFVGAEITMDLHKSTNIIVRYAYSNNTELVKNANIDKIPALLVFEKGKDPHVVSDVVKNREGYKKAIKGFLHINTPNNVKNQIYTGKWIDSEVPNMSDFIHERERQALKDRIKKMGDVVFQMDLENALRYSLKHEVASTKTISGEKLNALKAYLNLLVKYFPFGMNGKSFLIDLRDAVGASASVEGETIAEMVESAEKEEKHIFSSPADWLACKGSSARYRGYPCSVWKLFHFFTVNAAEHNIRNKFGNPREVLETMHAYIKNYFGCADCSNHFQEMAKRRNISSVKSFDQSIMWLWAAHNEVNKRLSGDQTEDPEYPKYQFPSNENCPLCHGTNDKWNEAEVLKYLKHIYSSINVRYIGSDTRVLHMGLEGSSTSGTSSIFQTIDTSMCLILYIASFLLILTLIRMFLKRGYRKKMYVHDLLGKV